MRVKSFQVLGSYLLNKDRLLDARIVTNSNVREPLPRVIYLLYSATWMDVKQLEVREVYSATAALHIHRLIR